SVNEQVVQVSKLLNLEALLVSHNSINNFDEASNLFNYNDTKIYVRSLVLSRMLESLEINKITQFYNKLEEYNIDQNGTYVVAHDAEILGYESKEKLEFFEQLLKSKDIKFLSFKDGMADKSSKKIQSV